MRRKVPQVKDQYSEEIAAPGSVACMSEAEAELLAGAILANVKERKSLYDVKTLGELEFTIRMQDCEINPCFNIRFASGEPMLWRSPAPASGSRLVLETSSRLLFYAFASDWGGDAITLGYGCEIYMFDEDAIQASLDVVCLRLLTRQPAASRHFREEPFRLARHLFSSPTARAWLTRAALKRVSEKSLGRLQEWR
jgi:hypothetical protein